MSAIFFANLNTHSVLIYNVPKIERTISMYVFLKAVAHVGVLFSKIFVGNSLFSFTNYYYKVESCKTKNLGKSL